MRDIKINDHDTIRTIGYVKETNLDINNETYV